MVKVKQKIMPRTGSIRTRISPDERKKIERDMAEINFRLTRADDDVRSHVVKEIAAEMAGRIVAYLTTEGNSTFREPTSLVRCVLGLEEARDGRRGKE
jgi:hypothetical protein